MESYWLAFYRFGSIINCPQKGDLLARLDIMERISASCGFWYPRDGVCIVSDRFSSVSWDESRNNVGLPFRLHRSDGPAISFRDGWGQYYWHGLRIPLSHHWIIESKDRINPETIEGESNAELRRVMLEIFGFERYLEARESRIISQDELHGFPRRLHEVMIAGQATRIIEVVNGSLEPDGSRRKFHLGAMPGDTPHDVIAASYGISPQHYREAIRS